jgi:NAD(P)-dependent dehydrogenase (short-subunit alcohol dehydrogenase family)
MVAQFEGSIAIITGAASDLGKATATLLAADGAKVACVDVCEEAGQETAAEIERSGGSAICYPCDISDPTAVRALVPTSCEVSDGQPSSATLLRFNSGPTAPKSRTRTGAGSSPST